MSKLPLLLLSELRADRIAGAGAGDEASMVLARSTLLLRHARETGWGVAHLTLKQRRRTGPIPGLGPLPSEPVFALEAGPLIAPQPLFETLAARGRAVAVAGFAFQDIIGPVLSAGIDLGLSMALLEDAAALGLEREWRLRALARAGVAVFNAETFITAPGPRVVRIGDFRS